MYQLPHYSDALKQFPSAALSAYFATGGGTTNGINPMGTTGSHHPFAAAAAAAAAVVSHNNPFSIDNILAPRPRLPVPLSPYYGSTSASTAQATADFYCKYIVKYVLKPKVLERKVMIDIIFFLLSMINVFNC